jgi:hypothetical protein
MDLEWMIYNWIDDLAGPYGAAIVVSEPSLGRSTGCAVPSHQLSYLCEFVPAIVARANVGFVCPGTPSSAAPLAKSIAKEGEGPLKSAGL